VIDEYTRECLTIRVERNLDHEDVQVCLAEEYNLIRPHIAYGYRRLAPQAWLIAKPQVSTPGVT
jgi:hypothetical protein